MQVIMKPIQGLFICNSNNRMLYIIAKDGMFLKNTSYQAIKRL